MAGQVQIRILQKAQKNEFFRHQAAAAGTMALKLQRFSVTPRGYRFSSWILINFFSRSILPESENRCGLPPERNAG